MKHEYRIVSGHSREVEIEVAGLLSDGWETVGGVAVNGMPYPAYSQAMRRSTLTEKDVAALQARFSNTIGIEA